MVDYLSVGAGLAGIGLAHTLRSKGRSFVVIDDGSQKSSSVAGGMYNPVILKRFTPVWQADAQLAKLAPFYADMEDFLGCSLNFPLPVYRIFSSVEEQNNWFSATDNPLLQPYMSSNIRKNSYTTINAPYGFGEVLHAGRVDFGKAQQDYKRRLKEEGLFYEETFDYTAITSDVDGVTYKNIRAKHLVFCEGYGLKNNPFFNYLPLRGTKGQVLIIRSEELNVNEVIKSGAFIIPLGDNMYKIGATYEQDDKTQNVTEEAKNELLRKLKNFMNCSFELISQEAGIRPTVSDRRPLVGAHPEYNNIYIINGLGSRGVMIAPYVAEQLYQFIEAKEPLEAAISIDRFKRYYS